MLRGVLSDAAHIELGRDNFYVVERHGAGVVARRSSHPIKIVGELPAAFETIHIAVEGLPTERMRLLVDLRKVVGRNDPGFEEAIAPLRRRLFECFAEVGLLLQSSVGALQLRRYLTLDGVTALLFSQEGDALAWVSEDPDV